MKKKRTSRYAINAINDQYAPSYSSGSLFYDYFVRLSNLTLSRFAYLTLKPHLSILSSVADILFGFCVTFQERYPKFAFYRYPLLIFCQSAQADRFAVKWSDVNKREKGRTSCIYGLDSLCWFVLLRICNWSYIALFNHISIMLSLGNLHCCQSVSGKSIVVELSTISEHDRTRC